LVIDELLKKLPKNINGTVKIILAANPLSIAESRRANSIDNIDLNRIFPGDFSKTLTERLAHKLIDIIKDSDAVIDLHSFEMQTPLMGILCSSKSKTALANKSLMQDFCPKQVWVIDAEIQKEKQFGKSLLPVLTELNLPNIAIEMNNPAIIDDAQITECVNGLLRVISAKKIIEQQKDISETFNFFNRTVVHSPEEGIFLPLHKTFEIVKQGAVIGLLRKLLDQSEIKITSPCNGQIMQVLQRNFVRPGQEIIAIGERVEVII